MDPIQQLLELLADEPAIQALTNEEVSYLEAETRALFASIRAGEVEGIDPGDVETLTKLRDAAQSFQYLGAIREQESAQLEAELADLDAAMTDTPAPVEPEVPEIQDETPEPETTTAEPVAEVTPEPESEVIPEPELEPVVAAAPLTRPALATTRQHAPARTRPRPTTVQAEHVDRIKRQVGATVATDDADFINLLTEAFNDQHSVDPTNREKVRLARELSYFPDELTLESDGTASADLQKLDAQVATLSRQETWTPELQARVATGGFCAPSEIDYQYAGLGSADRPVLASLVPFNATRGGLQTPVPLKLTDITTTTANPPTSTAAVSVYTEAMDIAGATTKPKQRITCGTMRETRLYAVTERLVFGNFGQRAWPELIAEWRRLTRVAHSRIGERQMLDRMKALADETLETERVMGAARDIAEAVARAAEAYRWRNRDRNVQLHVWMPAWVPMMGTVDLLRGDQVESTLPQLQNVFSTWLNQAGINVTFYIDTPSTGTSQAFVTEVSGTMLDSWPTAVQWCLAEEGHYLALGQPPLDLGIYRDPGLIDTNDAEVFMESFEAVHKKGVLSQWFTSKICVDGSWSDGIDGSTALGCAS